MGVYPDHRAKMDWDSHRNNICRVPMLGSLRNDNNIKYTWRCKNGTHENHHMWSRYKRGHMDGIIHLRMGNPMVDRIHRRCRRGIQSINLREADLALLGYFLFFIYLKVSKTKGFINSRHIT